jgi:hypothetical protein
MSISDKAYLQFKNLKNWTCPMCVPEFIPSNFKKITHSEAVSFNLPNMFKRLLRVMNKYDPIESCCQLINDPFTINMINGQFDTLYEKG